MKTGRNHCDLLLALGWLYLRSGHHRRGLVLVLLARHAAPDDPAVARTLAWAFVVNGSGEEALAILDGIAPPPSAAADPPLRLLRSRALWLAGRAEEARRCFAEFVALKAAA
jgi:type III secretion protein Y